jgi:hypothetical protein
MTPRYFLLLAAVLAAGCKPSGPPTTQTKSSQFATLAQRANFLHQYVPFQRTYETLDFDIMYQNNGGGMVPGPSDWDVRLVATVPASEMQAWIPQSARVLAAPKTGWLNSVPMSLNLSGVNEWYDDGQCVIGLDRKRRIVVYRWSSTPIAG